MERQRAICVFITQTITIINGVIYNYTKDSIVYDKDKNEYTVTYQCQKSMRRYDDDLKDDNIRVMVFARDKVTEPFIYLGTVKSRKVLAERTDNVRLTMQFKIPKTETLDIPPPTTRGQGKFKIPVFNALGVEPRYKNYMHGIFEVFPIT